MNLLLRALVVVAIALAVAACGGGSDSNEASDTTSTAPADTGAPAATTDEAGGDSGEPVTLTVWDRSILREDFGKQLIEAFEAEHPNVTVEYVTQPSDIAQADQAFRAASIAKNGPDIVTLYAGGMVNSFADFLEPQDGYWSEDEIAQLSGWDTVRQGFQPDGSLLAVPYGAGTYFEVFCNKENLDAAGVTIDTPPQTWEEFLDLMQQVKDGGGLPVAMGNQEGYTGAWVMAALVGGQIGTEGFFQMLSGDLPVNDPAVVQAYEKYAELFSRGLTNEDAGTLTNGDGENLFFTGTGACFISGDWQDQPLLDNLGEGNVISFPVPVLEGSTRAGARTGGPASAIAVTNYSENKEVAEEFVKFATSKEQLDAYVEALQIEPSNHAEADNAVIQNPLLRQQADETTAAAAKGDDYLIFPFDSIMPQEVNDLFYRLNAAVFTGQEDPQSAADQLQSAYDDWKESQP